MKYHKIFFKCKCGETTDCEIEDSFTCVCGLEVVMIYNPKEHIYEMEIINDGQNSNTFRT